jgi:dTDP-4-amino-4,6-dideoxygalactose transaminase
MSNTPIGGFFALDLPAATGGILDFWSQGRPTACFVNARSALAALVASERPSTVWLPAFLCSALADAVPAALLRYYPVGTGLSPKVSALHAVRSGDMVVGINYFGRVPASDFLDFVTARPNVRFVEDCAHYFASDPLGWGDWRLFSPRKLLGVADGGLLVAMRDGKRIPRPKRPNDAAESQWLAPLLRFEDEGQIRGNLWSPANQEKEAAMTVSDMGMTRLSRSLLELVPAEVLIERRLANFAALEDKLGDWLLPLCHRSGDVPFVFPLRLNEERRDPVLKQLHADNIFAAVHWREMPSPSELFPAEHLLARQLISLPCDHRYGAEDMSRIVRSVRRAIA